MGFFQNTVKEKYLQALNKVQVKTAYIQFKAHFHNPEVQQNIRASKEEQYQEGFLRDLFVGVLGYTLNPNAGFNLTTEYKNVKDSKKADGAIVVDKAVRAVIELKGTDTTDLDKIEPQAFGYKNNQPECTYIIISNFEKLRFYIDNAIDHLEFNLFTLTEKEFELLWLCLAYENIATDLPKKIKNASISEEDIITKNLYKDYSLFKRELYQNLVTLNPDTNELLLFKKSQKLLDRFLFLFFAEDRQLLPPNSVRNILDQWNSLKEMDAYFPLYSRFKTYFGYLNTGHKGKHHDVFAYNGGLFKPDDILEAIEIDDDLLYRHTLKLSEYDFASEVDVNILGHIFENSLNELDEIKAQLSGEAVDKTKTKRKKDGVFYTPKYITKYIVDNTVGKLCTEKQAELGINEEDYTINIKEGKLTKAETKALIEVRKPLLEKLTAYRDWLLQITICDPACGSGAFLNQALDFLINEHRYIDELQAKLFGDTLLLSDVENSILENNLFGVDINEESVEIAKLSLWLRTAQPNRKLNDLSNNIKCGNSLIDDPAVAGEKAFDWEKEFPQVFGPKAVTDEVIVIKKEETPDYLKLIKEKTLEAQQKAEQGIALSKEALEITKQLTEYADKLASVSEAKAAYKRIKKGFDVVIGNPPYVNSKGENFDEETKKYLTNLFATAAYQIDLYILFLERALSLVNNIGCVSFILPNTWLNNLTLEPVRQFMLRNARFEEIVSMPSNTFVEANVDTVITTYRKGAINEKVRLIKCYESQFTQTGVGSQLDWIQSQGSSINIFLTNEIGSFIQKIEKGSEYLGSFSTIIRGVGVYHKRVGHTKEFIELDPYQSAIKKDDTFIPYLRGRNLGKWLIDWREDSYISYGNWLAEPRSIEYFTGERILVRKILSEGLVATYIDREFIVDQQLYTVIVSPNSDYKVLSLLPIICSKLMSFYFRYKYSEFDDLFPQIKLNHVKSLPIKLSVLDNQTPFIEKTKVMLAIKNDFKEIIQKFQRMLQRKFDLEELPGKLQNWYSLSYKEFIAELGKKKIKLSLAQEAEWEDYFTAEQAKALEIKSLIDTTDREIDRMVYALYELTEEEVKIVEGK
jgi:type I restriction-modification system DNA methylase subunit